MNITAFRNKNQLLVDFMRHKLANDDYWLEVAMRILYERQTDDEKLIRTTVYKNMKGFNKIDARDTADIIVRYVLLGNLSTSDKVALKKILPKYAVQLYKRTNQQVQDKLETELTNPITRAGYKLAPSDAALIQDKGSYDRTEPLGKNPNLPKHSPGRILLTNKKVAQELLKVARLLFE